MLLKEQESLNSEDEQTTYLADDPLLYLWLNNVNVSIRTWKFYFTVFPYVDYSSQGKRKSGTLCKICGFSYFNRMIHKNDGASVSSPFIWKGFRLTVLEPDLQVGGMLLKNVCLENSRPSLLCSIPFLMSHHRFPSETRTLLIAQMVASFSDSLKVMSVDVTFLIGSYFTLMWLDRVYSDLNSFDWSRAMRVC